MSACNDSNIKKSFIVQASEGQDIFSACTALYTNQILPCTGDTININGNVNNIGNVTGNTFYGDGSNLTGISTADNYVTGGTYNSGSTSINFSGTNSATTFSVDVNDLLDNTNNYVTDANWVSNTLTLTRNGGLSALTTTIPYFSGNSSGNCITDFYVTNIYGCSPITIYDQLNISGLTNFTTTINLLTTPTLNNSLTEILTRDSSSGEVKYRDVSSIIDASSADTYVSQFDYDGVNQLTITRNDGTAFTQTISTLSASSITATTFYGDGSNLTGISTQDTTSTGGTYNQNTDIITITNSSGGTFSITGISDTFITGMTFNPSNYQVTSTRNDGVSTPSIDLSILSTDMVVTGGTYNINNGIVTFTNNSGGTFDVSGFTSGMTDSYTTDANLSGNSITFDNNLIGVNYYNVSLTPLLSGKTNNTTFSAYTSTTLTTLNGKVDSGLNVGDGEGVFRDKTGTTLNFKTIKSTGSTVDVSTVGDTINLEVTHTTDTNGMFDSSNQGGTWLVSGYTLGNHTTTTMNGYNQIYGGAGNFYGTNKDFAISIGSSPDVNSNLYVVSVDRTYSGRFLNNTNLSGASYVGSFESSSVKTGATTMFGVISILTGLNTGGRG